MEWITTTTLLRGLGASEDRGAWQRLFDAHHRALVGFARRMGLGSSDAEDAAQEALIRFADAYKSGRYERSKGRLRDWLFGFARHSVLQARRAMARAPVPAGSLDEQALERDLQREWKDSWEESVLQVCLQRLRRESAPRTFAAFELAGLGSEPASEVARRLEMTPNAVYLAKFRLTQRLRALAEEYER